MDRKSGSRRGHTARAGLIALLFTSTLAFGGPTINVWYGNPQKFGQIGVPQRWVNIVGNVSSPNGIFQLQSSLNGGMFVPISWGPDTRRLAQAGDFNIDIPTGSLSPGSNTLVISAQDNLGGTSQQTLTIVWTPDRTWPQMYSVYWANASSLSDSVEIVDGLWATDGGGVRTTQPGYDRIIAIGDTTWTDYEVQAQLFIHAVDQSDTAYDGTNGGPAVGFLFRWNGHTNNPTFTPPITQPLSGYLPYGAIGWYHFKDRSGTNNWWELLGNNLTTYSTTQTPSLPVSTLFNLRMRVKTTGGVPSYYFKAWQNSSAEPGSWLLQGTGNAGDPSHGSFLLLAHRVDASYGAVLVSPLGTLTVPTLASPANGSSGVFGGSVLSWNQVTNAGSYGLQVSTSPTFSSGMLVDLTGIRDTDFVLPSMPSSTTYYWHVRAENPEGASSYSAAWSFTTTLQPPTILSPLVNAVNVPAPTTLIWSRVNGSTYGLQVGTDSTFATGIIVNETGLVDSFRVVSAVQFHTRYFWRVNAKFGSTTSAYSSVGSFTTTVAAPVLASPADGAVNQPTPVYCRWHPVGTATMYRVQVGTDQTFASGILLDDAAVVDTFRLAIGVQPVTRYYWRVAARDANGWGAYSPVANFVTTLAAAQLVSPANGSAGLDGTVNLLWRSVPQAQNYSLQVSTDPAFVGGFLVNDTGLTDTARTVTGILNNATYYWRACGTNANGAGPYSTAWSFSTLMIAPTLLSPIDDATDLPLSVTFQWSRIATATSYQLTLATDSTFATGIVKNDTTIVDTTRTVAGLQNGVSYFWRVRAKNGQGSGAFSATFKFRTVGIFPSQVVLVSPITEAFAYGDSARFIWRRSAPSVTRYWMELAVDSLFTLKIVDSTITDTTRVVHPLTDSAIYWWKVRAYNAEGWGPFSAAVKFLFTITDVASTPIVATGYRLDQNYPNPFNPTTGIRFQASGVSEVRLVVYDVLGREVAVLVDGRVASGTHEVRFNASGLASGVYLYRLTAGGFTETKAMILAR